MFLPHKVYAALQVLPEHRVVVVVASPGQPVRKARREVPELQVHKGQQGHKVRPELPEPQGLKALQA